MNERIQMLAFDILRRAIDKPEAERQSFVREACDADATLLREVESLLHSHSRVGQFLSAATAGGAECATDSPRESPGTRIGRYELVKLIGEGGFGSVFRARQEHPVRREVALKVIKLGMDTKQVIARFEAERQALAMMNHPHIAKVLEAGATDAGRSYFVMELVEGVPVTRYCDEHKLTIRQRLELFIQVCQAVQHAHTKGIIHRDLKPSNILVAVNDGIAVPKVIDFGIAKATQGRLTEQSFSTDQQHLLGTPQYMSPEQADGGVDIDTRTDVYSLGVILYELLCGAAPFDFKSSGYSEIQRIIREQDPPPPSSKTQQRELKGDLDRIVLKAMQKDRSRRYDTASDLGADIRRHLEHAPVLARTPSAGYRLSRFVRRHRVTVAAACIVALAVVIGILGLTVGFIRASRESTHAQQAEQRAEVQRAAAGREARKAQAVSRFVTRMLVDARPGGAGNQRVVDLLKLASKEVETTLRDQPEAEIDARQALSDTYFSLGLYAEAEPQSRRAYDLSVRLDQGVPSPRTLRVASKLALVWDWHNLGNNPGALQFARDTFATAVRTLGESHPVTRLSGEALARIMLDFDQPAEAEQVLRTLLARKPDPEIEPDVREERLLDTLINALHFQGKGGDEAMRLQREEMRQVQAEKEFDPVALCCAEWNRGEVLADQGHREQALEAMRLALNDARLRLGTLHHHTQVYTFSYALALQRSNRGEAAINLLNENVRLIRSQEPADNAILARALTKLGKLQLARRHTGAFTSVPEALAMTRRISGADDPQRIDLLRNLLLGRLGSWNCVADGRLAAQVYCALDEMLGDNLPASLTGLSPTAIKYQLRRWRGSDQASVAQGFLEDLGSERPIDPGLYLLALAARCDDGSSHRQEQWILFAPWECSILCRHGPSLDWPSLSPDMSLGFELPPEQQTEREVSVPPRTVSSLAFMSALAASPAPNDRNEDFGIVARTSVELPAGRYRFIATSNNGVRLYVDGNRVIDAWTSHASRKDTADRQLSAGPHELKVENFQAGGSYKLWVRVEPLER